MSSRSNRLFERMVNAAIDLPSPTPLQIREILLLEILKTSAHDALTATQTFVHDQSRFGFDFQEFLDSASDQITTLRALHAWLRNIDALFVQLKDACNALDVLRLELIRHINPQIYRRVIAAAPIFVEFRWTSLDSGSLRGLALTLKDDKRDRRERARALVEVLAKESNIQDLVSLLEKVFPVIEYSAAERMNSDYSGLAEEFERAKRLAHPRFWERYLRGRPVQGEVPDSQIAVLLNDLERIADPESNFGVIADQILKVIDASHGSGNPRLISQVLDHLHLHRKKIQDNPRLCWALIRALAEVGDKFSIAGKEALWTSDRDKAQRLMMHLLPKVPPAERARLLTEIARTSSSLDMVTFVGRFSEVDWRSLTAEDEFIASLNSPAVNAAVMERVAEELRKPKLRLLDDPARLPLVVISRWLDLLPIADRPAGRQLATDYVLALVAESEASAKGLREVMLDPEGRNSVEEVNAILDTERMRERLGDPAFQADVKTRLGDDAHLAMHQCANWLRPQPKGPKGTGQ